VCPQGDFGLGTNPGGGVIGGGGLGAYGIVDINMVSEEWIFIYRCGPMIDARGKKFKSAY